MRKLPAGTTTISGHSLQSRNAVPACSGCRSWATLAPGTMAARTATMAKAFRDGFGWGRWNGRASGAPGTDRTHCDPSARFRLVRLSATVPPPLPGHCPTTIGFRGPPEAPNQECDRSPRRNCRLRRNRSSVGTSQTMNRNMDSSAAIFLGVSHSHQTPPREPTNQRPVRGYSVLATRKPVKLVRRPGLSPCK